MANIRNSISLQDHMTPVFRSIMRSMDSTLRLMKQLDRQSNNGVQSKAYMNVQRDIQRANNELIRMQNNIRKSDSEAKKLKHTVTGMGSSFSSSFNLTSLASGLYLIKNAISAISSVMETPDSLNLAQYRMEQFDTTGASGGQLYNQVYKTALDSRSDLNSTSDLASRILVSGATKGSGGAAIEMAGLLNKASLIGGSTQEEAKRALIQLSQGLSSGVLQGDELRAIREQAPGLTDVLSKGLSSMAERGALPEKFLDTTIGDLKELGAEGELTADRIIAAFAEMEDYIDETFDKSPKTFSQAMTGIGTVWKNFLKIMSQSDNALGRLTNKAWDLLEFFTSDEGTEFFESLGSAINFVVECVIGLIEGIEDAISWFSELENSSEIAQSALFSLGAVAVGTGVAAALAWMSANWQILAVVATIGLLTYICLELGATIGQVVGGIIGVVLVAISIIWNIIVALVVGIIQIILAAVELVILVVQTIVQLVLWMVTTIWQFLRLLDEVFRSIFYGFQVVVGGVCVAIAQIFQVLATIVLGILWGIAKAIDWVFGSNLADTVSGWISGLDGAVDDLEATYAVNVEEGANSIGDSWKTWAAEAGAMYSGSGNYDDWNITDNMVDTWNGMSGAYDAVTNFGSGLLLDEGGLWDWSMGVGEGLDNAASKFNMEEFTDMGGMLDQIAKEGVPVNGGNLDGVNSDVDISDEDIQLLRDIAARDFLLNVQTVTPKANIKFGDVRETADVNKIMEVIEDMVEEQMATALIVE